MNIGILTSGGDCPGMNAFLFNFVQEATANKFSVFAFRRGYQGLIENDIIRLTQKEVQNIAHLGGSHIKSFRSTEFITEKGFKKALVNVKANNIDCMVILGGDGTFRGCEKLRKHGINIIFVPATIDNDLSITPNTLGFDTAVNNAVDAIDKIKQTTLSLNRIAVVEVMGRNCAGIAEATAKATNAAVLIRDFPDIIPSKINEQIKVALENGDEAPLVIVRENVLDSFSLAKDIQNSLDIETRACILGYIQRGGTPTVADRIIAKDLAIKAISLLQKNIINANLKVENKISVE